MLPGLTAVDLFAGAGGATQGLKAAGYRVLAAVEKDADAAATYATNHPEVTLYDRAIERVQAPAFARQMVDGRLDLLTACPPCQGFSTLGSTDPDDPRNRLISSVARFVRHSQPRAVLLENVPGLTSDKRLGRLIASLEADYTVREYVVNAADFGVPQSRRRVIVLGIDKTLFRTMPDSLIDAVPSSFDSSPTTAGTALKASDGLTERMDPTHRARRSTELVLARIRASTPGSGRENLPRHLRLACHQRLGSRSATSIYGRIDPEKPAPTMTTRCTTPSCGRFIHPQEDRGLTLREASLLQTFPINYAFVGTYGSVEQQIGNAVPVALAEALGRIVDALLSEHGAGQPEQLAS